MSKLESQTTKEKLIRALLDLVCAIEPKNIEILALRGSYDDTMTDDELIDLIQCEIEERQ